MTTARVAVRSFGGNTFRCSDRTYAHLEATRARLHREYPKARLVVIQGAYNTSISASAGTHDYDAVLDVRIDGLPGLTPKRRWLKAQAFLRGTGWAAWWRHTGTWFNRAAWHIHMISIPPGLTNHPSPGDVGRAYLKLGTKVGKYIDGGLSTVGSTVATSQVVDYYNHAYGLAGQHQAWADKSWFPKHINVYVFRG